MSPLTRPPIKLIRDILAPREEHDLFPELAFSLFAFVLSLYRAVRSQQAKVHFLSREGLLLMRLYNIYAHNDDTALPCYLEASRLSTFLPSLGQLDSESFETLFRQYPAISGYEFLASLGLSEHADELQAAIGITTDTIRQSLPHFPSSRLYHIIRQNKTFRALYEERRTVQRQALLSYLMHVTEGRLSEDLFLVDVGWKGTLQDNLRRLLSTAAEPPQHITGYYLGLIEPGQASPQNVKHGLLFSALGRRTPHFSTFNESRTLFEIALAADHGPIVSYALFPSGTVTPIRGAFHEQETVLDYVVPLQKHISDRFRQICFLQGSHDWDESDVRRLAGRLHARMVFRPTLYERNWFSRVLHVEHFGHFTCSHLTAGDASPRLVDRLRFAAGLSKRRNRLRLGFWPYLTIYNNGGRVPATIYGLLRQLQAWS